MKKMLGFCGSTWTTAQVSHLQTLALDGLIEWFCLPLSVHFGLQDTPSGSNATAACKLASAPLLLLLCVKAYFESNNQHPFTAAAALGCSCLFHMLKKKKMKKKITRFGRSSVENVIAYFLSTLFSYSLICLHAT